MAENETAHEDRANPWARLGVVGQVHGLGKQWLPLAQRKEERVVAFGIYGERLDTSRSGFYRLYVKEGNTEKQNPRRKASRGATIKRSRILGQVDFGSMMAQTNLLVG